MSKMVNDLKAAMAVVDAYEELIARALEIVSDVPFYASVDDNDGARITFDGDDAVLSWSSYESDYYGGGSLIDDTTRFPAAVLFLSDAELSALRRRYGWKLQGLPSGASPEAGTATKRRRVGRGRSIRWEP